MDSVSHERNSSFEAKKKRRVLKCFKNYWKELKARSSNIPSILLLIYATTIPVCITVLFDITTGLFVPLNTKCNHPKWGKSVYSIPLRYAPYFLIPFCGWLSDTKIGRGNAIYLSLWLGWVGTLLQSINYCLQYNSCGITALIGRYGFSGVAFILLSVSSAFMYTNILPYGIDQMMNVSSVKIRAFIHWFVWDYYFCFISSLLITSFFSDEYQTGVLIIAVAGFALFSFSLCLNFHLQHRFEHIPIPNPYKIVFKVLKYSIQNNHNRRQRSAFTYWGKEPSRIDLAKDRYGGSFTHEEVENVKTILRILAVMIALVPSFTTSYPFCEGISGITYQFKNGYNGLQGNADVIWFISYSDFLILIPLFELIILPLFPKLEYFLINPLRGLGLANMLIILSILSVFLIDLIGRAPYDIAIPCFNEQANNNQTIQVSYWILLIPSILSGLSIPIAYICTFEFLCSQAPFGMHGMIIGLFWLLRNIFSGTGLHILQYAHIPSSLVLSCTSWFSIIFGLVGLVGLVVYVLTARWYVKRIRDTDLDLRTEIEQQWEQRLIKEDSYNNNNQTDYDTFIISSVVEYKP